MQVSQSTQRVEKTVGRTQRQERCIILCALFDIALNYSMAFSFSICHINTAKAAPMKVEVR